MLHTKFRQNRPTGCIEKILKGFHHTQAWLPSCSCEQHHVKQFSFPCTLYLKAYIKIMAKMAKCFLCVFLCEKSEFHFSYVNDLRPRSRNDLDLK